MILNDGTCIPSYLGVESRGTGPDSQALLTNYALRYGEVRKLIYPDEELSISKTQVEYDVEVEHRDETGVTTTSYYRGVSGNNWLGGFADKFHATYRSGPPDGQNSTGLGVGSKVLLLCVSGDTNKAIILGGLRDPGLDTLQDKREDGHNLWFEFNGVRFTVDKDGQPTLKFRGATKNDGTLADSADPKAEGTTVRVTKDGSLTVATPSDKQFIKLDHTTKTLEILADSSWNAKVNGNLRFEVGSDNELISGKSQYIRTKDDIILFPEKGGVLVGQATDQWVKGTSFRRYQKIKNKQYQQQFTQAFALCTTAGSNLTAAAGLNAIPLVGGALALAPMLTAAQTILQLGTVFANLATAVFSFEANEAEYLSPHHWTD
jgi:hypothetical protein